MEVPSRDRRAGVKERVRASDDDLVAGRHSNYRIARCVAMQTGEVGTLRAVE